MVNINTHKINVILAKKGMKKIELAELALMKYATVLAILKRGRCRPANAEKISSALGVDAEELLEV